MRTVGRRWVSWDRGRENEGGRRRGRWKRARRRATATGAVVAEGAKGVVRERTRVFFHHQLLAASANPSRSSCVRGSETGGGARTNNQTVKVPNSCRLLYALLPRRRIRDLETGLEHATSDPYKKGNNYKERGLFRFCEHEPSVIVEKELFTQKNIISFFRGIFL